MAKEKGSSKIVGNLWSNVTEAQKAAGVVLTGSIEGVGRITVFKRKEKRPGKKDSDYYVVADLSGKPEPKEAETDANPF